MPGSSFICWKSKELGINSITKTMSFSQKVNYSILLKVNPLHHLKLKTYLIQSDRVCLFQKSKITVIIKDRCHTKPKNSCCCRNNQLIIFKGNSDLNTSNRKILSKKNEWNTCVCVNFELYFKNKTNLYWFRCLAMEGIFHCVLCQHFHSYVYLIRSQKWIILSIYSKTALLLSNGFIFRQNFKLK